MEKIRFLTILYNNVTQMNHLLSALTWLDYCRYVVKPQNNHSIIALYFCEYNIKYLLFIRYANFEIDTDVVVHFVERSPCMC